MCRKSKKAQRPDASIKQIETEETSDSDSSDVHFITSITTTISAVNSGSLSTSGYTKEIYSVMEIGNQAVTFQIDCGVSINIIAEALVGNSVVTPTSKWLVMWNKMEITPCGATRIVLRNPKKYSVEFVVVKVNLTPLIGTQAAQHMKLITVNEENFVTASPPCSKQAEVNYSTQLKRLSGHFLMCLIAR